ncbi:universal stress protein [Massilia niastensis]|uniref:universal stress protein n=1 Tax=Massilia niastensis TaxID=544911 RepID=UPI00037726C0|nr:universal stress protein [Massilia niastensis]
MYKTIVINVDDGPLMESRLLAAAWLADAFGAHLVGSAVTGLSWSQYALLTSSLTTPPPGEDFQVYRDQAHASLQRFRQQAGRLGIGSAEERLVEDDSRHALLLHARYADLVVTSQEPGRRGALGGIPQYIALHSPRPVLVVPGTYAGAPIGARIVAGWDGSMQAIRALDAALPFLARAEKVTLALADPEHEPGLHGEEPGADMARYLARHGVKVEVACERGRAPAGEVLLAVARNAGADLMVTGAFGHSRYRELVLGGVTRILLERSPLPLLIAH